MVVPICLTFGRSADFLAACLACAKTGNGVAAWIAI